MALVRSQVGEQRSVWPVEAGDPRPAPTYVGGSTPSVERMTIRSSDSPSVNGRRGTTAGDGTGSKRRNAARRDVLRDRGRPRARELPARSTARARNRYARPNRSRGSVPGVASNACHERELGRVLGLDWPRPRRLVEDRVARPLRGQAPAVPAEHRLVQVEVRRRLAGDRRRRRALDEALVRAPIGSSTGGAVPGLDAVACRSRRCSDSQRSGPRTSSTSSR